MPRTRTYLHKKQFGQSTEIFKARMVLNKTTSMNRTGRVYTRREIKKMQDKKHTFAYILHGTSLAICVKPEIMKAVVQYYTIYRIKKKKKIVCVTTTIGKHREKMGELCNHF